MAGSTDHKLGSPNVFLALRIVQLVAAIIIVGFMAYGLYLHVDSIGLMMQTAVVTILITIYEIIAETCAPFIYNYWVILGLDIYATVCWLVSVAFLVLELIVHDTSYHDCKMFMRVASGLGGLESILFITTIVFVSKYLRRHRKAGGHCAFNFYSKATDQETNNNVEAAYGAQAMGITVVENRPEMANQQDEQLMKAVRSGA